MKKQIAQAAEVVHMKDIRELSEPYGGLTSGISIFSEILDYLTTFKAEHLDNHLKLINTMMDYRETTGWNRHSQFVALALSHEQFDYARKGLSSAISWLFKEEITDFMIEEEALGLANKLKNPLPRTRSRADRIRSSFGYVGSILLGFS